jgi:hypothetical protein
VAPDGDLVTHGPSVGEAVSSGYTRKG